MKKTYTKKSAEERKAEMQQITAQLETGIKAVFESAEFKSYLDLCSRIHHYSLNNQILIHLQKPDASLCMSFKKWKDTNRFVKKGEHGLKILAPIIKKSEQTADEDEDESKEIIIGFKQVYTFDISQTDGEPLPFHSMELSGEVEEIESFISAVKKIVKIPVTFEDIQGTMYGYFSPVEKKIVIKKGLSGLQTLKTLLHEAAHSKLHGDITEKKTREQKETEAEAVAYIISQHYGIDTSDYSFKYLASWSSEKTLPELKASLETIRSTAAYFIDRIDEILSQDPEPSPEGDGPEKEIDIDELIEEAEKAAEEEDRKLADNPVILVTPEPEEADNTTPDIWSWSIVGENSLKEKLSDLLRRLPNKYILNFYYPIREEYKWAGYVAEDMRKYFPLSQDKMAMLIKHAEKAINARPDDLKTHIKDFLEDRIQRMENYKKPNEKKIKQLKANLAQLAA